MTLNPSINLLDDRLLWFIYLSLLLGLPFLLFSLCYLLNICFGSLFSGISWTGWVFWLNIVLLKTIVYVKTSICLIFWLVIFNFLDFLAARLQNQFQELSSIVSYVLILAFGIFWSFWLVLFLSIIASSHGPILCVIFIFGYLYFSHVLGLLGVYIHHSLPIFLH